MSTYAFTPADIPMFAPGTPSEQVCDLYLQIWPLQIAIMSAHRNASCFEMSAR